MKNSREIKKLENVTLNFQDKFFFDTNVWLYLYYPQSSDSAYKLINKYSSFLAKVLQKECLIETNLLQISEVVNWVIQTEYRIYKQNAYVEFKKFRELPEGLQALENAKTIITSLLKHATPLDGIFNSDELKAMAIKCDKADFNDIFFSHFCMKQKAFLVTHDFDFNALDDSITVISGNNRYFQ